MSKVLEGKGAWEAKKWKVIIQNNFYCACKFSLLFPFVFKTSLILCIGWFAFNSVVPLFVWDFSNTKIRLLQQVGIVFWMENMCLFGSVLLSFFYFIWKCQSLFYNNSLYSQATCFCFLPEWRYLEGHYKLPIGDFNSCDFIYYEGTPSLSLYVSLLIFTLLFIVLWFFNPLPFFGSI